MSGDFKAGRTIPFNSIQYTIMHSNTKKKEDYKSRNDQLGIQAEKKLLEAAMAIWVLGSQSRFINSCFWTSILSSGNDDEKEEEKERVWNLVAGKASSPFFKHFVLLSYSSATNMAISDIVGCWFFLSLSLWGLFVFFVKSCLKQMLFIVRDSPRVAGQHFQIRLTQFFL